MTTKYVEEEINCLKLRYSKIRKYLQDVQGFKTPGKGMLDLISTIKGSNDIAIILKDLRRIKELEQSKFGKKQKPRIQKSGIQKPHIQKSGIQKPQIVKTEKHEQKPQIVKTEKHEQVVDPVMQSLKEALALRGISTAGNSYDDLIGRLLHYIDDTYYNDAEIFGDDYCEDDETHMKKLKEELAIRGKTIVGDSYRILVKRFLKALAQEEKEED